MEILYLWLHYIYLTLIVTSYFLQNDRIGCSTLLLIYPVVFKVSKIASTMMYYNIKMLLHAFVGDKNRII